VAREGLSGVQRLAQSLLPARWFAAMRDASRQWRIDCPCGWHGDVWMMGGIRWGARGTKRVRGRCPSCGERRWMTVRRGD